MSWQTVLEGELERTEVLELPRRGCLARICVRASAGEDAWRPVSMTWCPGLKAADFSPRSATDAATESDGSRPSEGAASMAGGAEDPDTPSLVALAQQYGALQVAVLRAFREKVGRSAGKIGFCDNLTKVGGFSVPGHGDWVWRIDDHSARLTHKKIVIIIDLPAHTQDEAFDAPTVARYLKANGHAAVSCSDGVHPTDPDTIERLMGEICKDGPVRLLRSQPRPTYTST